MSIKNIIFHNRFHNADEEFHDILEAVKNLKFTCLKVIKMVIASIFMVIASILCIIFL